jgi:hypothetical protein
LQDCEACRIGEAQRAAPIKQAPPSHKAEKLAPNKSSSKPNFASFLCLEGLKRAALVLDQIPAKSILDYSDFASHSLCPLYRLVLLGDIERKAKPPYFEKIQAAIATKRNIESAGLFHLSSPLVRVKPRAPMRR